MIRATWAILAAAVLVAAPARGQAPALSYEWADSAGAPVSAATLTQGVPAEFRLYVRVVADPAGVIAAGGGFDYASVRATSSSTAGAGVVGGAVDLGWEVRNANSAGAPSRVVLAGGMLNAGRLPDAGGRLLIGAVTLRGEALGAYTATAADPFPSAAGDITLFDGTALDIAAGAPLALSVVPVPEPAALVGAGALVAMWRLRRRRRGTGLVCSVHRPPRAPDLAPP